MYCPYSLKEGEYDLKPRAVTILGQKETLGATSYMHGDETIEDELSIRNIRFDSG